MATLRGRLLVAQLGTVLFLMALAATTVFGGFVLRRATGIGPYRLVGQGAGLLAGVSFLVGMALIAVRAALQPAKGWRKAVTVLPAYFIGFTLTGLVLALLGIGTVGNFIVLWLAAGLLCSIIATLVALGRLHLPVAILRATMTSVGVAGLFSLVAWLAMIVMIVIGLTSPAPPLPEGNFGGPGGRQPPSTLPLIIGGVVMTLFVALQLWAIVRGWRLRNESAADASSAPALPPSNYWPETRRALFTAVAISVIAWLVALVIPLPRSNPPAQTAIQWDSPQTQSLAQRACMDCHSNETVWPWYAYVPPGSWLTVSHVMSGRDELNFSELNNLPSFRRNNLREQVGEVIRRGTMPPKDYFLMHSNARLTPAEQEQLMQGLQKSLAQSLAQ